MAAAHPSLGMEAGGGFSYSESKPTVKRLSAFGGIMWASQPPLLPGHTPTAPWKGLNAAKSPGHSSTPTVSLMGWRHW